MSMLHKTLDLFGDLGFFIRRNLTSLGLAARMFAAVIWRSGFLLKRPRLVSDQILFLGNYSFVIIAVSNKFGLGPINDTKDITMFSRIESIGGLVTCANNCLK
jgi:hypothetical protein